MKEIFENTITDFTIYSSIIMDQVKGDRQFFDVEDKIRESFSMNLTTNQAIKIINS